MKKLGIVLIALAIMLSVVVVTPVVTAKPVRHVVSGHGSLTFPDGNSCTIQIFARQIDDVGNAIGTITRTVTPVNDNEASVVIKVSYMEYYPDDDINTAVMVGEIVDSSRPEYIGMGVIVVVGDFQTRSPDKFGMIDFLTPEDAMNNLRAAIIPAFDLESGNFKVV